MHLIHRRKILHGALAIAASSAVRTSARAAAGALRLGLITNISPDPDAGIRRVHDLGFPTCQVYANSPDDSTLAKLRAALDRYKIEATSAVCTGPGREIYDFYQGPETIGLVPRGTRAARIAHMKTVADFAQKAGIPAIQGHCGFLPENPNDALYKEVIEAIRDVASYCKTKGINLRCETGQETPITLVRAIRDVGTGNVGVNFDAANLVMYGKANPVDAVSVLAPYIQGVHVKDGVYPTDPHKLGAEVAIGQGVVNWRALIAKLKEAGYSNPLTIEREISGAKQTEDIRSSKTYLEGLIG
ncbi:MAG TPA: sugar phosphate isomerase/epimerase family protein [Bryobacteraceae bacterium]|jgi:sugar phosphate isomerase/epimerase|nr:sugar phosphate isomerase/epimerase family protein [Bryobacteraceae bacterium]